MAKQKTIRSEAAKRAGCNYFMLRHFDADLRKELRMMSASTGQPMNEIILLAVRMYLLRKR
jgi:hypothetical protein